MSDVAVIGLGVMGRNLVLNLVDHGYTVHVFNRTTLKTKNIEKLSRSIFGHETLESLVRALPATRKIFLMVQAGEAVDEFLSMLDRLLDNPDIVIDCGNSHYKDSARRVSEHKYNFVGCGISGGEFGARYGPSMMVGCREDIYNSLKGIFEDISAKHGGKPCCGWMGEGGAGHFVKVVHNGIEYCEMQLLQEVYNAICFGSSDTAHGPNETARRMFEGWNRGRLGGYLMEICGKILRKKNSSGYVIDQILDKAEQKGTGKMCVLAGVEAGAEVNAIAESVFARFMSHQKEKRSRFRSLVKDTGTGSSMPSEECMEKAFYLCKAIFYVQGASLLVSSKNIHGWSYSISQVCEVWKSGCILRCEFLDVMERLSSTDVLEASQEFLDIYDECAESLKTFCKYVVESDIYCPLFSNCLMWLNGLKMSEKNGNLVQAMRDYFGRHGVVLDSGERLNVDWKL